MKGLISAFILGVILTSIGFLIIGGNSISDFRKRLDKAQNELELADKSLIRSRIRIVQSVRIVETVRTEIRYIRDGLESVNQGLGKISDLSRDSLQILEGLKRVPSPLD